MSRRILATLAILAGTAATGVLQPFPMAAAGEFAIAVVGNHRMDAEAVRSYFHPGANGRLDANDLDAAIKALYATGQFQDVQISRHGDGIVVQVVENPIIKRVAFEGNSKLKDEQLKKEVQSQERGPLSRALVQSDVQRIADLYRRSGRFDVQISPKVVAANENRADLIFEIVEGKRIGVREIRFVGNNVYSARELKGVIKTGQSNFMSFLLGNDVYDTDRIEADRELLHRYYLARGYADMRVAAAMAQYDADKKGIVVTFRVDEGARYRVGTVDIKSELAAVDPKDLRAPLRTQSGDVYNAEALQNSVEDLSLELGKRGLPFATVRPRVGRSRDGNVLNLVYTIAEGPHLYVERIDIHGNDTTLDRVIRREFDFAEGDAYARILVDRAERRLKNLGFFKTVKITKEPGSTPDRVVLNVNVEEQRTGDFSISGGYSTEYGILGEVSVSERNFLGRGEYVKASVSYGEYERGFGLSFVEPYIVGTRAALGLDLSARETMANSYQTYDALTYGGKISLGLPLTEEIGGQVRYSLYNQSVTLDPTKGVASLPIRQAAAEGPRWVSSIGTSVTYSTVDNIRSPKNGLRATVNEDVAGLGGDARFIKTTEDLRYYHEFTDNVVGMVRGQGGYVTPFGGKSLSLLDGFFGGPQFVRGFAPNGFGPRDLTPGTSMDNIGGNVYWATTAELQAPVPLLPPEAGLKVAVFADAGSLWGTSSSAVPSASQSLQTGNSKVVRSSVGVGLVWDSLFGPIRVDYSNPLSKASYDVVQRVHFGAGGF
jgi:outer membrane protein insertion porin family